MQYILETEKICKSFPEVKALNDVSISILPGEVHGIVGENGAGKSTLMSILSGVYRQDSGKVYLCGEEQTPQSPHAANQSGISIVHQELSIIPNLSIAENLFANRQPVDKLGMIRKQELYEQTADLLKLFAMQHVHPGTLVKYLSVAQQQVVEIIKAISIKPKVLILDEPTSCLTSVERTHLFENIRRMKSEGTSFIYISHHLNEIFEICDSITILKDGEYVCDAVVSDIDENFIVRNMVGREISDVYVQREDSDTIGSVLLDVKNISAENEFENVSFSIREGEMVGFFGLVGAGRTEVARSLFGLDKLTSGEIALRGKMLNCSGSKQAIQQGVSYTTEDRKGQGLYLKSGIKENLVSNHLKDFAGRFFMKPRKIARYSEEKVSEYGIVASSIDQKLEHLSGGNQQKVMLATWLGINPKLLMIDEPTKGVDIGARSDIYRFLRNLARQGAGVLMISSDLLEVLGMSDRIYVMKSGRIVGELSGSNATEENVIALATGVTKKSEGA